MCFVGFASALRTVTVHPMRVLHTECSMNWGGQELRTVREDCWLNARGHASWIFCHPQSEVFRRGSAAGARVLPLDLNRPWRLDRTLRLVRFCRKERVDLINAHSSRDALMAFPAARLAGARFVRSRHTTSPIRHFALFRAADQVITLAECTNAELRAAGVSVDKLAAIGTGFDPERFHPDVDARSLRAELGIADGARVVLNVGMIRSDKGQRYLVEAAEELIRKGRDYLFVIVGRAAGRGDAEIRLREQIAGAGLAERVMLTGYRDDIPRFMALAEVYVNASTGVEGQSQTTAQAFATRVPVVGTKVGGIPDLVRDGENGLLVEPKNPAQLAAAIDRLLQDEPLRRRLAANGHEFALRELTFERTMEKILEVYRKALS
jgi:glycosyltransferase involved in cell wall biosynthesis